MNSIQLRLYFCAIPSFIITMTLCFLLGFYNNVLLNLIFYIIGYYVIPCQIFDLFCIVPYNISFYSPIKIKYKKIKYNLFSNMF